MIRLIIDGNNMIFRNNVMNELYDKNGNRTSGILGTLNNIHFLLTHMYSVYKEEVSEIYMTFDAGHSKRRLEIYPEYKANRKKDQTDEELQKKKEFIEQANSLCENLHLFGVKPIRVWGAEADDIIYCLSEKLKEKYPNDMIFIVSTDQDFHQLIDRNVSILNPISKDILTAENYEDKIGIPLNKFITYKILVGDSSDGIKGIQGIGEKTAKKLVNSYESLDEMFADADTLRKSKRLARIVTEEGAEVLDRNNQLINLKDFVDKDSYEEVDKAIEEDAFVDTPLARKYVEKYYLASLLVKWDIWIAEFSSLSSL